MPDTPETPAPAEPSVGAPTLDVGQEPTPVSSPVGAGPRFLAPPLIGSVLDGRYRVKSLLGAGGIGWVFEARDIRLGRHVAVKVIRSELLTETQIERLFREARAAAKAEHPAVIITYGYGTDHELDIHYIVMEYLRGETLAERIARFGRLPAEFIVRIGLDMSDALAAVHEAEIVHRDLKPSNVFLAVRGRHADVVTILDFGIAKQLDMVPLTSTGQVCGTPLYMAPEQLRNSKEVDARCDIYALGVLLFECAAGVPPWTGRSLPELVIEITDSSAPDLRALRPDLPLALIAIIERCMAKRMEQRFQRARAVFDVLSALEHAAQ